MYYALIRQGLEALIQELDRLIRGETAYTIVVKTFGSKSRESQPTKSRFFPT